jgi:hypothetical protein
MRIYRVLLPVEINGRIYQHGETVRLDLETAIGFADALIAMDEGGEDGRDE